MKKLFALFLALILLLSSSALALEIDYASLSVDELQESDVEMNVPYNVGETVKVISGPFNDFSGIIEEVNNERKKLKVMVMIFGRKTPLELSFMQVEKEQ